jgi:protein-S-isoprenylcysteine O-methyltransferase Ste14
MKHFINFGNWIFRYRNIIFPLFYLALFIPSPNICSDKCSITIGVLIIVSGILIRSVTIGLEYIVRGGYKGKIYAENLVTGGIYTLCRNPMYVGNILLIAGFGIFANSLLFILLFSPLFLITYFAIIKAEEAFLTEKFGEEYVDFKNNVNSLLPDLRKINSAFKGYRFNCKRILIKEYNSLYIYFSGIELILLYKEMISFSVFLEIWIVTTLIYFTIKILKKRSFK